MVDLALATLPFTSLFDRNGLPLTAGKVEFLDQATRAPKTVYSDAAGTIPYSNPLDVVNKGQVGPLYFETDAPYFLECKDSNDTTQWTSANFTPSGGGVTPITLDNNLINLVINGQFRFFEQENFSAIPKSTALLIAPDAHYFFEDGTNPSDTISFIKFLVDDNAVTETPIYYMRYQSISLGPAETEKYYEYRIKDVKSLSNSSTSNNFSFAGSSLSGGNKSVTLSVVQFFGTGGTPSPTVVTNIGSITLTSSFVWNNTDITVPDLTGKTIGTNGDDYISLRLDFPLNQVLELGFTNIYHKIGVATPNGAYPYETYDLTAAKIQALEIPVATRDDSQLPIIFNSTSYNAGGEYIFGDQSPVGLLGDFSMPSSPPGWYMRDGLARVKGGFPMRLFEVIAHTYTNNDGFSYTIAGAVITMTCDAPGVAAAPASSDVAFINVAVTVLGTASVRQVVTITFSDLTSATSPTLNFTMNAPGVRYVIWVNSQSGLFRYQDLIGSFPSHDFLVQVRTSVTTAAIVALDVKTDWDNNPVNGVSSTDNFTATAATNIVTVTLLKAGVAKSSPSDGTSGFTIAVTTPGSPTGYEVLSITTVVGSALSAGVYFTISTVNSDVGFYAILNGEGTEPTAVSVDDWMPFFIDGTESSNAMATIIKTAVDLVFYRVPDHQGLFGRYISSPFIGDYLHIGVDSANRINRPDGGKGNLIGTLQYDDVREHQHIVPTVNGTGGSFGIAKLTLDPTVTDKPLTEYTGGGETRAANYLAYPIIKW